MSPSRAVFARRLLRRSLISAKQTRCRSATSTALSAQPKTADAAANAVQKDNPELVQPPPPLYVKKQNSRRGPVNAAPTMRRGEALRRATRELKRLAKDSRKDAVAKAQEIMAGLEKQGITEPVVSVYNGLLGVYAQRGMSEEAEEVFANLTLTTAPDDTTYRLLMHAHAKSIATNTSKHRLAARRRTSPASQLVTKRATERCMELLQELRENPQLAPNTSAYTIAMDALAQAGKADEAESVLKQLLQDKACVPDAIAFSTVIHACGNSRSVEGAKRATEWLKKMENYDAGEDCNEVLVEPTADCYHAAMDAWARSGSGRAGIEAEAILNRMKDDSLVDVGQEAYTATMNAWSSVGTSEAAERVQVLLEECLEQSKENPACRPSIFTFNVAIFAWARTRPSNYKEVSQIGERCEKILGRMLKDYAETCPPTKRIYQQIIGAWAKTGQFRGARKAEEHLQRLQTLAKTDPSFKPDKFAYHYCMEAWSKCKDRQAGVRAEKVFQLMEEAKVKPDAYTYNILMTAWNRSGDQRAVDSVEKYLAQMKERFHNGGDMSCRPSCVDFDAVFRAWKQHRSPAQSFSRGMQLLEEMKQLRENHPDCHPQERFYRTLLLSLVSVPLMGDKHEVAWSLVQEMEEQGDRYKIDQYVLDKVLGACAYTTQTEATWSMAWKVLQRVRELDGGPSLYSYRRFFRAFSQAPLTGERLKNLHTAWQWCIEDGFGKDGYIVERANALAKLGYDLNH